MYQVAFKVTYADDLKNFHNVILNGTVAISGRNSQSSNIPVQQASIFDDMPIPMIGTAAIGAAMVGVFLVKRKRSKNKKMKLLTQGDTDIVSIFDGVKKNENES